MVMMEEPGLIQNLKECMLPISARVLCIFPFAIFLHMLWPGLQPFLTGARPGASAPGNFRDGPSGGILIAAILALAPALLVFPTAAFASVAPPPLPPSGVAGQVSEVFPLPTSTTALGGCMMGATVTFLAFRWVQRADRIRVPRKGGRSLSHVPSRDFISQEHAKSKMTAVEPTTESSLWHSVSLFLRNWLDDETGLLHFVNEMPRGSLQKFELQTELENNVIREDVKGSERLKSFGQPVPFNYGCFPQTYRDPQQCDELHNAPGDDDPLDVIDVSRGRHGVGELLSCRVLGAVCLIDEGQADWKIFVNSRLEGPEGNLRSMNDVEKLWPGRTMEILSWMDDFKQHQNTGATHLHYEVHDADVAMAIVRKDHEAWKKLLTEADARGFARGHWVGGSGSKQPNQGAGVLVTVS